MKTQRKFGPNDTVTCWESFSAGVWVVNRGTTLRASHPVVEAMPGQFVRSDVPEHEWPVSELLPAEAKASRRLGRQRRPEPIPDNELAVVLDAFSAGGEHYPAGRKVRRDSDVVKRNPELFGEIPRRLSETAA